MLEDNGLVGQLARDLTRAYIYIYYVYAHTHIVYICVCVYVCVFEDEHLYSLVFVRRAGRHTIQPTSARFSIYAYA